MAKAEVTRKWLARSYNCVSVGYCELQTLLRFQTPGFYTCGVYGWNFDCYTFGDYAITTGYRGMINNCDNNYSYELAVKYENQAKEIRMNWGLTWKQKKEKIDALLTEFLQEVFDCDLSKFVH